MLSKNLKSFKWDDKYSYELITFLSVFGYMLLMWMFTGKWPFDANTYNSYALQADAWRQGRLYLDQNYSWLELAYYQGRYYVSFPPFPSYILFPLTFIFGSRTPDNLILWIVIGITVIYVYRLALECMMTPRSAMITGILVMIGSNQVFNMFDASVWFFAQMLCFILSTAAIYYAMKGKGGASLFCWACAVGCRPMQAVFLPVLLFFLYGSAQDELAKKGIKGSLINVLKYYWKWAIPPAVMGLSYMALNMARFGSPLEFGHNYLPEFTESTYGQFSVHYIADNLGALFRLPDFASDGKMVINHFGNLSMLLVSPIFLVFLFYIVLLIIKKKRAMLMAALMILVFSCIYMVIVLMHKTMGGWHFGNRYSNDILPWVYFGVLLSQARYQKYVKYQIPLIIWGTTLNAVGCIAVMNGWG